MWGGKGSPPGRLMIWSEGWRSKRSLGYRPRRGSLISVHRAPPVTSHGILYPFLGSALFCNTLAPLRAYFSEASSLCLATPNSLSSHQTAPPRTFFTDSVRNCFSLSMETQATCVQATSINYSLDRLTDAIELLYAISNSSNLCRSHKSHKRSPMACHLGFTLTFSSGEWVTGRVKWHRQWPYCTIRETHDAASAFSCSSFCLGSFLNYLIL